MNKSELLNIAYKQLKIAEKLSQTQERFGALFGKAKTEEELSDIKLISDEIFEIQDLLNDGIDEIFKIIKAGE